MDIKKFRRALINVDNKENAKHLDDCLKQMFDPFQGIEAVKCNGEGDLVKCIIGDNVSYDAFFENLRIQNNAIRCHKSLSIGDFIYRCHTCKLVSDADLCSECFQNGNHKDHEYTRLYCTNIFTCDCGRPEALIEEGFCEIHKIKEPDGNTKDIELYKSVEILIPNLLYRILQFLREIDNNQEYDFTCDRDVDHWFSNVYEKLNYKLSKLNEHINFLNDLCRSDLGIRRIITSYLLNEEFYEKQKQKEDDYLKIYELKHKTELLHYNKINEKVLKSISKLKLPDKFKGRELASVEINNMFDELLFSWIYLKSPEVLLPLLLTLIKESNAQDRYKHSFLKMYCLFDNFNWVFQNRFTSEPLYLNNQLFQVFCKYYEEDFKGFNLLETLLASAYDKHKQYKFLNEENKYKRLITNKSTKYIQQVIYLSINQLLLVFKNRKISYWLLSNEQLFDIWMRLVSFIQGMNIDEKCQTNVKHTFDNHSDDSIDAAFDLEKLEAITIKHVLLQSLSANIDNQVILNVLNVIKNHLMNWKKSVVLNNQKTEDLLTFHLPLHRYLSDFVFKAISEYDLKLTDLISSDEGTLQTLLSDLLAIQVGIDEIQVDKFKRRQATKYIKYQFIDSDLFLIQCIASLLEANNFIETVFNRFHIFDICKNMLHSNEYSQNKKMQDDKNQEKDMITAALAFLAQVTYRDINLRENDINALKNEVLQWLTYSDCKFTDIKRYIKVGCFSKIAENEIVNCLNLIADFIQPDYSTKISLEESYYSLKGEHWINSYDPLYFMYYRSGKDNLNATFERYSKFVKSKQLTTNDTKLFLPFRIPCSQQRKMSILKEKYNIVNSRTLHGVLFTLLYQHLYYDSLNENVFQLVIYNLELAINNFTESVNQNYKQDENNDDGFKHKLLLKEQYSLLDFGTWYKSNNILDNLAQTIPFINLQKETINQEEKKIYDSIEKKIVIEESMISLLVKLFYKENKEANKLKAFTNEISDSRIGDYRFFINNLLNKVAKLSIKCRDKLDETLKLFRTNEAVVDKIKDHSESLTEDLETKVLAKKNAILSNMSDQQDNISNSDERDESLKRETNKICFDGAPKSAIECCICKMPATLSIDRPVAMICRVDATCDLYATENDKSRSFSEQERVESLLEAFDTESCKQSISINYKGSAFISTCGHYLHFDCYKHFTSETSMKEFNCPKCNLMTNLVIPVKNTRRKLLTTIDFNAQKEISNDYIDALLKSDLVIDPKYVKTTMFCEEEALQVICETVPYKFRYVKAQTSDDTLNVALRLMNDHDALLFLLSTFRNQIELFETRKHFNHKCFKFNPHCLLPLFDLFSTRCQLLSNETKPHVYAWNLLTKSNDQLKTKLPSRGEVPVLLRDPVALFLLIIFNLPEEFHRTTFIRIVNTVFNLAYIRGILMYALRCENDELIEMISKKKDELHHLDDYLAFIAFKLNSLPVEHRIKIKNKTTHDVRLEKIVHKFTMPFLKVASFLKCQLFNDVPQNDESFESLIKYLQIDYSSSKKHLDWYEEDPLVIIDQWMNEFLNANVSFNNQLQTILTIEDTNYKCAQLMELPENLNHLFSMRKAGSIGVCLICCSYIEYDKFREHSATCYGLYLNFFDCRPFIYTPLGNKAWGPLYLDKYGQENLQLEEEMYLSKERYELLKILWMNQNIYINFNAYV